MVYSLGAKRAEFLFEDAEERAEKIRQIKLNQQTTFPYISHALMIFQFRAVITLALEKEKSEAKIVRFRQGVDLKNDLKFRGETPELVPDGFFTIEQDDGRWHFFLEADRSTMILDRFLGKLKIYWEWWREEKYKERLDVSRFRVLTITISKERKENLRRIAKNADPRKTGSNMFFFFRRRSIL